jgi:peptide/nickel transport system permease protein
MFTFILRRLAFAVPTLLGVSLLTFVMLKLVPGDPVLLLAGEDPTPEHVENIRRQLGLDQPVPMQYLTFLSGLPRGYLGVSYATGEPIAEQIARRYPRTLILAVSAMLFGLVFGILIGTLAGLKPGSPMDGLGIMIALAGISIPSFWLALMLIFLFSVQLRWLPMLGMTTPAHLVLPTITMGVGSVAFIARMTRANVIEVMQNEYIRTARAKGLRERSVVVGHVLKNALMPVITVAGISFGFMLGGAAIAEVIFSIDGLGRMMVDAIFARDVALVQAGVMVLALNFVLITLLLDIVHGLMDPRVRHR